MDDMFEVYALLSSIVVLAILVYFMYREGSADSWKEISLGIKQKIRSK